MNLQIPFKLDDSLSGDDDVQSDNSDSEPEMIQNRKVRFAETFEQRENLKKLDSKQPDTTKTPSDEELEEEKVEDKPISTKPKKMRVNQEYVKDLVKK